MDGRIQTHKLHQPMADKSLILHSVLVDFLRGPSSHPTICGIRSAILDTLARGAGNRKHWNPIVIQWMCELLSGCKLKSPLKKAFTQGLSVILLGMHNTVWWCLSSWSDASHFKSEYGQRRKHSSTATGWRGCHFLGVVCTLACDRRQVVQDGRAVKLYLLWVHTCCCAPCTWACAADEKRKPKKTSPQVGPTERTWEQLSIWPCNIPEVAHS